MTLIKPSIQCLQGFFAWDEEGRRVKFTTSLYIVLRLSIGSFYTYHLCYFSKENTFRNA